ncbi:hypothetical protein N0V93_004096 [Gnomoniopsis smithogilvyi]|uniref:Uncharacterized protein n=1 Tax=Gnomoniopsis smithogilvyi TaxID=1191159 RepID=A0A9W8YZY9_9PEZI|nr:hypothetical protein N0V93_004096 [Gnomoniopsis smithogilvyi]
MPNLSGSIVSANNQNIAGLVNVNLDISLFQCKPPAEFAPIGSALSRRRRDEAEGGSQHKVACRLGFLFNDIIPETPKLLSAYGRRVSDTLARPGVNPSGTDEDGPFRDFVGADGTSIWAAATSISASISVYLLACLLARAWDAKQATAIWAELVAERKRQIQDRLDQNQIVNPHTMMALQQDFERQDLAKWDASARSWLQRADDSMAFKRTQFSLIMENVRLPPFVDRGKTYDRVINAWFRSMEVLEALLRNEQRVAYDHVTLLAISAWHLYPDLLVFQDETKKIPFNDHLFSRTAVLSLGIEYHDARGKEHDNVTNSTRWSLALSHLKYYGGPVDVTSPNTQRASVDELWLVCLGMILGQWEVSLSTLDISVSWFAKLGHVIRSNITDEPSSLSWLLNLCLAASVTTTSNESKRQSRMAYVRFGHRRTLAMLGPHKAPKPPFFGLCNPHVLHALQDKKGKEIGFKYLRSVASCLGLSTDDALIQGTQVESDNVNWWTEWVTIGPIPASLVDWELNNAALNNSDAVANARWIFVEDQAAGVTHVPALEQEKSLRMLAGEYCEVIRTKDSIPLSRRYPKDIAHPGKERFYFWPPNAPRFFARMGTDARFIPIYETRNRQGMHYKLLVKESHQHSLEALKAKMAQEAMVINVEDGLRWLEMPENSNHVVPYLQNFLEEPLSVALTDFQGGIRTAGTKRKRGYDFSDPAAPQTTVQLPLNDLQACHGCQYTIKDYRSLPLQWIVSMRALEIISALYKQFQTATIPIRVTDLDFSTARWLPESLQRMKTFPETAVNSVEHFCEGMARANSFSCIAMLESGQANMDLSHTENVVALCSGNSIFVAGILLSDPTATNLGMHIRHLIGNVGHPGIVLMVTPAEPAIRTPGYDVSLVQHQLYDGRRIDTFKGTSLHLSFTQWKMPVFSEYYGEIDQQVFLLEAVISVQDRGRWVADLDVLCLERDGVEILEFICDCKSEESPPEKDIASLDSWDELLDAPPSVGVVRASGNWVARLSIASALVQKGYQHCVALMVDGPKDICWKHMIDQYAYPEPHLPQFIIN